MSHSIRAKKLSKSQANYSATKGELFTNIYFLNHWQYYLKWKQFLLRTDHRPLQWIPTMEAPSGMVARWLRMLADYNTGRASSTGMLMPSAGRRTWKSWASCQMKSEAWQQ
jgi:hypothetical protein